MKKYIISIVSVLIIVMLLCSIIYQTQAVGLDIIKDHESLYIQNKEDNTKIVPIANIIVAVIRAVGIAISLLMLTLKGIKYITGRVQEKAEYKQTMWPYIIGAILIFAGSAVVDLIYRAFFPS